MTTITLDQKINLPRTHFRDLADLKFVIDSEYLETRLAQARTQGEFLDY